MSAEESMRKCQGSSHLPCSGRGKWHALIFQDDYNSTEHYLEWGQFSSTEGIKWLVLEYYVLGNSKGSFQDCELLNKSTELEM